MGRKRVAKEAKQKRVTVQLIPRYTGDNLTESYRIMEMFVKAERDDLKDLTIGMAWRIGWRPDPNRVLKLGECRKRGDLDRELDDYDFIILLNQDAFNSMEDDEKRRLIFHQLMHAQVVVGTDGKPKKNDRGRFVCRIRKHDFEEFRAVMLKFNCEEDLSDIAQERIADAKRPLLKAIEEKQP